MFNVGPAEVIVILLIALLVFGPKRLPEIGKTVGKGLREFRKATQDIKDEISSSMDVDEDEDQGSSAASAPKPVSPPASTPTGPMTDTATNLDGSIPNPNGDPGAATGPQLPGGAISDS